MEYMGGASLPAGMLVVAIGYLTVCAYFLKPEEFYVKRFRPAAGRAVSHRALILRAYGGIGLVHTSVQGVGFYLASRELSAWDWAIIALAMCPILGSMTYAYFRLARYRKASPAERASEGWGDGAFVLRAPFRDELKTNWAKRVDKIARTVFPVVFILAIALVIALIAYGLIAG